MLEEGHPHVLLTPSQPQTNALLSSNQSVTAYFQSALPSAWDPARVLARGPESPALASWILRIQDVSYAIIAGV